MKLNLIDVIDSPLSYMRQAIWVSVERESFLLTDIFKVAEITFKRKTNVDILSEAASKDEAYKMKKVYEDRFASDLYEEISLTGKSGFKYLSVNDYNKLNGLSAGSDTYFDLINVFGIHKYELPVKTNKGLIMQFQEKQINVLNPADEALSILYSLPFKAKEVTAIHSFHNHNLLVYGTNDGKIYLQSLSDQNIRPIKVDDCKTTCQDIYLDANDEYGYICGMGYLKIYKFINYELKLVSEFKTSARSVNVFNNLIILNKGMHGIELLKFYGDKIEKLDSLDIGFTVDLMRFNKANKTILISSKPIGKLALLKVSEPEKRTLSLSKLFKFGN
ncbi:hypothetical protein [Snuella sedimenti]|uniref:WD40 repeat domain-containing protein n=1 Tax=Snuella sedimenti TaxID=2798802 RepID=A0A8J7IHM4_9FLAO|nr:hypothetical protein [Snuella sedimenti]MBJ6368583.1 hypothetical protein [Snuella sedimenti]